MGLGKNIEIHFGCSKLV